MPHVRVGGSLHFYVLNLTAVRAGRLKTRTVLRPFLFYFF